MSHFLLRCSGAFAFVLTLALSAPVLADNHDGGLSTESAQILEGVLAAEHRSDADKARDGARRPADVLAFFGVEADMSVVEVWPGGGWYTHVLAPYAKQGGGSYIAAHWDTSSGSEFIIKGLQRYKDTFADADIYGAFTISGLSGATTSIADDNSVDAILTFRNIHNWMARGDQDAIVAQLYKALKPGGVLGVVEHRASDAEPQDPKAANGYVREDYAIALFEKGGFEFVSSSDILNNPADTKDHPFGVWTLPPTLSKGRGDARDDSFDSAPYAAIGESDRFTLKFVKPAE